MFRELYKQANDEIKGDRQILDKAFELAQKPEKKPLPIFKYSFVGTAVAAVILLGAIFANTEVFMKKTVEPTVDGSGEITTEVYDSKVENEFATEAIFKAVQPAEEAKPTEQKVEKPKAKEEEKPQVVPEENEVMVIEEDYEDDVMVLGLEDGVSTFGLRGGEAPTETYDGNTYYEEDEVGYDAGADFDSEEDADVDSDEDDTVLFFSGGSGGGSRGGGSSSGGNAKEATEAVGSDVPLFSYWQDVSNYSDSTVKEGFVNTTVSPVTNKDEASKRAGRELDSFPVNSVSYDPVEKIWRVEFINDGPDGVQSILVYINSDGITQMIVYPGYYFGE